MGIAAQTGRGGPGPQIKEIAMQAKRLHLSGLGGLLAAALLMAGPRLGAAELKFTTWTDPTERAFTVQVPSGWKISGGINRRYLVLLCEKIVAASPDGKVWVYAGNDFPSFVPPNVVLQRAGIREG